MTDPASNTGLVALAAARSQHNEQRVLAERSLENEQRVAVVRVIALAMSGLSQAIIGAVTGEADHAVNPVRIGALVLYGAFSVVNLIAVRRAVANVVRARVVPLIVTTVDVAFVVVMEWADLRDGGIELDGTVGLFALIISYAILRLGAEGLWYTAILAVGGFGLALHWAGEFAWARFTFVAFLLFAMTLLLSWTRQAVRVAFVDLKRRESLSKLLPHKVVDEILAGREELLRPTRRDVTVLFSDIRDFTTYSEGREPEDVLRFLDDYFGRMTQVVQGHDGSVNKFIGDGLMAIWGAPGPLDRHAVHAVKAAIDMQRVVAEMNERRVADGQPALHIGIGVHTGMVAAGMLGGSNQSEFTVIGDAVNLASRIEGLTKTYGVGILVSDATWQRLGGGFEGTCVGEAAVKGRKGAVTVYAVGARSA